VIVIGEEAVGQFPGRKLSSDRKVTWIGSILDLLFNDRETVGISAPGFPEVAFAFCGKEYLP